MAVKLNGKTVGLLLDLTDEGKHRRDGLDADLPSIRSHQSPGTVAVVLHHAEGGDVQAEVVQHPPGDLHVVLTAVNEHQVRESPKLLVPVQIPLKAPLEHLFHGGVVVGPGQVFDFKAAVVSLQGPSVLKDHHGGHHVIRASVGDVVGLGAPGRLLQAQHLPQGLQQFILPLFPGGGPGDLLHRVLVGQLDEVHFGSPLGGNELHPPPGLLAEHPGKRHLVIQFAGKQNLPGQAAAPGVILSQQG